MLQFNRLFIAIALVIASIASACGDDGSSGGAADLQSEADASVDVAFDLATDTEDDSADGDDASDLSGDGADASDTTEDAADALSDAESDGAGDAAADSADDAASDAASDADSDAAGDAAGDAAVDADSAGDADTESDTDLAGDADIDLPGDADADTPTDADADGANDPDLTDVETDGPPGGCIADPASTICDPAMDPTCEDGYEANDTFSTATPIACLPIALSALSIDSADDDDWFSFELGQAGIIDVRLTFTHTSNGDIDLEVYRNGTRIGRSQSESDDERVAQFVSPGSFLVRVYGFNNSINSYAMTIDSIPDLDPEPDRFEPNETSVTATPAASPFLEPGLSIHSASDEDWFEVELEAEGGVSVTMLLDNTFGDLDMFLYTDSGAELESAETGSDEERMFRPGLDAGTYYVRVIGWMQGTNTYDLSIQVFEGEPPTDGLFSDLRVLDLFDPVVFGSGPGPKTVALMSHIDNLGTAPAPGSTFGDAYATFRLISATTGEVVDEGVKGPIFLTNNGGCPNADAFNQWIAFGSPEIPGTEVAITTTDPGCVDEYVQSTNNSGVNLNIEDLDLVPNGDYFYEVELDEEGTYLYEPSWARANNLGRVRILIRNAEDGINRIAVPYDLPIERSGQVTIDTGIVSTVVGNGADLGDGLASTFSNLDSGLGRVSGVNLDPDGSLWFALQDDGSLCLDDGAGQSTKMITGLDSPMAFDFADNGDVYVAAFGSDSVVFAESANDYATPSAITLAEGFVLEQPTAVRVAGGLVYICNSGGHEILEYNPAGGATRRVAGTGVQGFNGDGPVEEAMLSYPTDIDVTADGLLVIADGHNNRLRAVNLNDAGSVSVVGRTISAGQTVTLSGAGYTSAVTNFFQNGTTGFTGERRHAMAAIMDWPFSPRVHGDRIYFVDADNHRVRVIDEFGYIHTLIGSAALPSSNGERGLGSAGTDIGDDGPGVAADINRPTGLLVRDNASAGVDIYVGDTDFYRIRFVNGVTIEPIAY